MSLLNQMEKNSSFLCVTKENRSTRWGWEADGEPSGALSIPPLTQQEKEEWGVD